MLRDMITRNPYDAGVFAVLVLPSEELESRDSADERTYSYTSDKRNSSFVVSKGSEESD